jgi:hypothetical protein
MFSAEHRIALREPFCRSAMQISTTSSQNSIVNGIPDQRVGKQERIGVWTDQQLRNEPLGQVVGALKELAKRIALKSLTEDGCGLEGGPIERVESVEARLHETLNGSRHPGVRAFRCMAQQLIKEERVARGSLDTALDQPVVNGEITPCH